MEYELTTEQKTLIDLVKYYFNKEMEKPTLSQSIKWEEFHSLAISNAVLPTIGKVLLKEYSHELSNEYKEK